MIHRLERSLFAGAVAAAIAAVCSLAKRKTLAARAAAAHESVTHLMITGLIGVALVVGAGVFIVASIHAARKHNRGQRRQDRRGGRRAYSPVSWR
jgi:predicted regulator of Ras-like GTPase activity (Roadblock/LC7/MglB family)